MTNNKIVVASDLSPRVVQLARVIDRLVPGEYEIIVSKPDISQQDWRFEITRKEKLYSGNLSIMKYQSE